MGCSPFRKRCSSSPYAAEDSNPDPINFTIKQEQKIGQFLVLHVHYPNCTNYEGNKLMVYEDFNNSNELLLHNYGKLDPHFSNNKGSPVARFKPNQHSIELIKLMAFDFNKLGN